MHGPLNQFAIKVLIPIHFMGYDLSFTNSSLFMLLTSIIVLSFHFSCLPSSESKRQHYRISNRLQAFYEMSFEFIRSMVLDNTGKDGIKYFPLIFSIFFFIVTGNLLGIIPFSFTFTSHPAITASLAILVFFIITFVGFARHGLGFFRLFCPKGVPFPVIPLLVPVEIIAYFFRPVTLAIRLCANMTAGHMILKLFGGFSATLSLVAPLSFLFLVFFTAFEVFVALLQAYVFTILTCIYLHDSIHLH